MLQISLEMTRQTRISSDEYYHLLAKKGNADYLKMPASDEGIERSDFFLCRKRSRTTVQ
jgi:hypothetical protein